MTTRLWRSRVSQAAQQLSLSSAAALVHLEADGTAGLGEALGAVLLVFLLPERKEAASAFLLVPPSLAALLL